MVKAIPIEDLCCRSYPFISPCVSCLTLQLSNQGKNAKHKDISLDTSKVYKDQIPVPVVQFKTTRGSKPTGLCMLPSF